MKPFLAAFAGFALCIFTGWPSPGQTAETVPALEAPNATPLGPPMQSTRKSSGRGMLSCTYEDQKNAEIHVLLCRFEDSESCVLINPTPLQALMQKYEGVKFLVIGSTPEGCSKLTFTGSLKTN